MQTNQYVNIYAAELKPAEELQYDLKPNCMDCLLNVEGAWKYITSSGAVHRSSNSTTQAQAAVLHDTRSVSLHGKGKTGSHVLLINMLAQCIHPIK